MTDQAPAYPTSRVQIILAIVVAVFFIIVVLVSAKIVGDRQTYSPVAMGPVDAPGASSAECAQIVSALPEEAGVFRKVTVAEPVPDGAAAYRNSEGTEMTVRCGVRVPDQYTVLSPLSSAGGASWFEVSDATPGSSLTSWYSVGASPVVAVNSEADVEGALEAIGQVTSDHSDSQKAPQPNPYPLSDVPAATQGSGTKQVCSRFLDALPANMGEWERVEKKDAPQYSATFVADSKEPVVVRCAVAMPQAYEPGAQLTQVDKVPWFSEPGLARGSTSGRWFALGYQEVVAVAMPQAGGDAVITEVSKAIAESMKSTEKK